LKVSLGKCCFCALLFLRGSVNELIKTAALMGGSLKNIQEDVGVQVPKQKPWTTMENLNGSSISSVETFWLCINGPEPDSCSVRPVLAAEEEDSVTPASGDDGSIIDQSGASAQGDPGKCDTLFLGHACK
jgi:hypothetical protein